MSAVPALAQVGGSLTVQNDYQLRGYSLSRQPAAILDLSYDNPTGLYANGLAVGSLVSSNDPVLLGWVANVGYARRISPEISVDAGYTHSEYLHQRAYLGVLEYNEAYLGVITPHIASHVYFSPDYFNPHVSTVYAEVEGTVETVAKLRLSAKVGVLDPISTPAWFPHLTPEYDWRVAVSRRVSIFDLTAALSGGGQNPNYYGEHGHEGTAFTFGATWDF